MHLRLVVLCFQIHKLKVGLTYEWDNGSIFFIIKWKEYFIKHWVLDYIILTITWVGKIRLMIKTKVREREFAQIFFFFLSKRERGLIFSLFTQADKLG